MAEVDHNKLINETYRLAVEGKHITVPFLQKELGIEDPNIARAVVEILVKHGKLIYVEIVGGERCWISTDKVKPNFGMPNAPEKDEKLIELIVSTQKDEISVYEGVVDISKIKPFCEYKPEKERFDSTTNHLKKNIENLKPPLLLLYQENNHLIMSDDYNAYFTYLSEGFKKVPCIILGETDIKEVENKERINYQ